MSKRTNAQDAQPPSYAGKKSSTSTKKPSPDMRNSSFDKQAENKRLMKLQGLDLRQDPTIYEETSSDGKGSSTTPALKKETSNNNLSLPLQSNSMRTLNADDTMNSSMKYARR